MHSSMVQAQQSVKRELEQFFKGTSRELLHLEPWGADLQRRLGEYAGRGKLIRGALVPFAWSLFNPGQDHPEAVRQAGVAMELMQSFLLIHDDIMDQDDLRRGAPSVHAQYRDLRGSRQYGVSMGICAGDVAAFMAVQQMASLPVSPDVRSTLTELFAREIISVGLAQMQDVHHGYVDHASREAVLQVYTWKTGRYTFSLPMMTGAILADASRETVGILAELGEGMGRVFQIRDDQLGIFGEDEAIGKPAGSDIRENKKTIFRELLMERLPGDHPVRSLFGRETLSNEELALVRHTLTETGVMKDVDALVVSEQRAAEQHVSSLGLDGDAREALDALLEYNAGRTV